MKSRIHLNRTGAFAGPVVALALMIFSSVLISVHAQTPGGNQPPVVTLRNPSFFGQPISGIWVFFGVQVGDPDGQVVSVEYFVNGKSIGTVSNEPPRLYNPDGSLSTMNPLFLWPFSFYWSLPSGEYDLRVKATDDRGASTLSDIVHFTMIGPPTVSVIATDAHASEPGGSSANSGIFTIMRTGGTGGSLRVYYALSGSASNGVDYAAISDYATIPEGQSSVQVVIDPLDDSLSEGREIVRAQLYHPIQWVVPAVYPPPPPSYYVATNSHASVYIVDDDGGPTNHAPSVTIVCPTDGGIVTAPVLRATAEDPDGTVETVEFFANGHSIGVASNDSLMPPLIMGTYTPDYLLRAGPPVLDANEDGYPISTFGTVILGSSSFNLAWKPRPGDYVITAKATDDSGATALSAPINVVVEKPPMVRIRASDWRAAEPGGSATLDEGRFTISRTGNTGNALRVFYVLSGTAGYKSDYTLGPDGYWGSVFFDNNGPVWLDVHAVTIPAGQDAVEITVTPLDDELAERIETVNVTLTPPSPNQQFVGFLPSNYQLCDYGPSYQVGTLSRRATVYLKDDDRGSRNHPPKVSITTPRNGRVFPAGSNIAISVKTVDQDSYVHTVEFFDGIRKIGEVTQNFLVPPPSGSPVLFEFDWTNASAGWHILTARATDTQGGVGISTPVYIRMR